MPLKDIIDSVGSIPNVPQGVEPETHYQPAVQDPLVAKMLDAMDKPRGIVLDCSDGEAGYAESLRFRFYKARAKLQRKGNRTLDMLMFRVVGNELHIIPGAAVQVRDR